MTVAVTAAVMGRGAAPARPCVRWHGGKWRLAPWIVGVFPRHSTYVEPFGGSGSVLLRKPRAALEVYNDLDGEVVNLFRVLRDRPDDLIPAIEATPFARAEFEAAFGPPADNPVERARRMLVRSHMGFSTAGTSAARASATGFRGRGVRAGTTPPTNWRTLPADLVAVVDRLRGVVIENMPALDLIAYHDAPETLFYCDPPYLHETRDKGVDYAVEMTDEDHADLLAALTGLRGRIVLSGYASEMYDRALAGWTRLERNARADKALARVEVLWLNFSPPQGVLL